MKGFELLNGFQEQGKILSYTTYYGMQRTRNFAVVMVEHDRVMDVVLDPDFSAYDTAASMLWDGWEWTLYAPDEESEEAMQAWAATAAELA